MLCAHVVVGWKRKGGSQRLLLAVSGYFPVAEIPGTRDPALGLRVRCVEFKNAPCFSRKP